MVPNDMELLVKAKEVSILCVESIIIQIGEQNHQISIDAASELHKQLHWVLEKFGRKPDKEAE